MTALVADTAERGDADTAPVDVPGANGDRAHLRRVSPLVVALVGLQAAILTSLRVDWIPGDAKLLYLPTARNLLRHGRYSVMDGPPYLPTITKMPGYSLFLAGVQAVFGERLGVLQAVQFVLVGLTALLAALLGRRLFDDRTGLVAGALVAVYPAFGVHAMEPLSEALTCLLATALVLALVELGRHRGNDRRALWLPVATGVTLGSLVLVRQTFAFLLPVVLASVVLGRWREDRRGVWRGGAVVCLLCGMLVGPWCARNVAVSDRFLPFGANSGLSLLVSVRQYAEPGDRPAYLGDIADHLEVIDAQHGTPAGTALGLDQGLGGGPEREAILDARLTDQARAELSRLDAMDIARGIPDRMVLLWSGASMIQLFDRIENLLMIAGLAGAVVFRARWRRLWPLGLLAVYLSAFHLVFHVEQRYSLPARPALLVLSAAALVHGGRLLRARWTTPRS
jgi:4-amino-4-deoxy-L-arabinose transferase-like glycosyltransferase